MAKVVLSGFIIVADEDLAAVEGALQEHIRLTRGEAGCLAFKVEQHTNNPNRFNVYEEFSDRASFDHHQVRTKTSAWAIVAKDAARHYQIDFGDETA